MQLRLASDLKLLPGLSPSAEITGVHQHTSVTAPFTKEVHAASTVRDVRLLDPTLEGEDTDSRVLPSGLLRPVLRAEEAGLTDTCAFN